jgi:hypothetical protein
VGGDIRRVSSSKGGVSDVSYSSTRVKVEVINLVAIVPP